MSLIMMEMCFIPTQIYSGGQLHHFIDGYNVQKSNWMRYVNPARSTSEQNMVACQNGRDIYFYTVRPVETKQELLVWYSPEFAQRLCRHQEDVKHGEWAPSWVFTKSFIQKSHTFQGVFLK